MTARINVLVRADRPAPAGGARLGFLLRALEEGATAGELCSTTIAAELADVALAMVLRARLEFVDETIDTVRLVNRPALLRAVLAVLSDPARRWTLDDLAAEAGLSRASLVRGFNSVAAKSPRAFLMGVRLGLARRWLRRGRPIAQVAIEVGYQSEAALSRALHRQCGVRPGALRRGAR